MAGLTSNRKGMRRFLLAYSQGKRSAYRDHPLNRGWFARHPRIDAAAWGSNPLELEMAGAIVLAQETDPLQVLMLGTYVGSCLGLGGMWSESAVACLLDANKQVIYARNAAGQVLARQLIAIDERDRLVCFPVYPVNADDALVRAFDDYDHSLARTLGIDIYRRDPDACDDYHVELILASEWYDDLVPDRGL